MTPTPQDAGLIERARAEAVADAKTRTEVTRMLYGSDYGAVSPEDLTLWKLADRLEALSQPSLEEGFRDGAAWQKRCEGVEAALSRLSRAALRVIRAREDWRSPDRGKHHNLVLEEAEAWVALQACFDGQGRDAKQPSTPQPSPAPQGEAVAWRWLDRDGIWAFSESESGSPEGAQPLYASPALAERGWRAVLAERIRTYRKKREREDPLADDTMTRHEALTHTIEALEITARRLGDLPASPASRGEG